MKILVVHRHYWPDTAPAATIFRSISRRWVSDGHDVTAFSAQPSYGGSPESAPRTERLDGSRVIRTWLFPESRTNYAARSLNYLLFFLKAFSHILTRRDYDIIVAFTAPPVLPGLVLRLAARLTKASLVFQCMDIFPELAIESGTMNEGLRSRILRRIDTRTVHLASRSVVLSEDMRQLLVERGANPSQLQVINNVDLNEFAEKVPVPAEYTKPDDAVQIVFAGNIGRFQGLNTVIDAAHALASEPSLRFDFFGTGVALDESMARAGDLTGSSVFFHGRVSPDIAAAVVEAADMALVTLAPGVIRAAYPSKTITYLRAGTPILAVVEPDSELGTMITTEGLGAVVSPGDAAGLASAIKMIASSDRDAMRQRCRSVYAARFERDVVLDKWTELAASIEAERNR